MNVLLKNGHIVDYATKRDEVADVLIQDGIITKIGEIKEETEEVIDCTGLYVIPGMIDIHCHLREPGFEYKETIQTGTASAVKGGFTTICPMPNTNPTPDNIENFRLVKEKINKDAICNVLPYASVTKGEKGEELVNFEELKKEGAIGFSDDGIPVKNAKIMREAIITASNLGSFVASHCEEPSVSEGAINHGEIADKLNVKGVLKEAEILMAAREIAIADTNNSRVHICHISTRETADLVKDAKRRGVRVTAETCPHYYSLTQEEVLETGANAKMNPPLRDENDRQAIIKALQDGTIDNIITDHAPHSEEEKERELSKAPNGIIGFETALPVTITYLIYKGYITYLDLVKLMCYNPAQLIKVDKGTLQEGKVADITIFNPNTEYVYTKQSIVSKSKNSPYIGKKLKGQVEYTIVNGKVVYKR